MPGRAWIPVILVMLATAGMLSVASPSLMPLAARAAFPGNTRYYIDDGSGCSDSYAGTSARQPWCDFSKVNTGTFSPGDRILLKCGDRWDQEMDLAGSGTSSNWITVTSYGSGARPKILRHARAGERGILLTNPDYWAFGNLEIGQAQAGILVEFTTLFHRGLSFDNIYVHDIHGITRHSGFGTAWNLEQSSGIAITGDPTFTSSQYAVMGVTMHDIEGTHDEDSVSFDWSGGLGASDDGDGHNLTRNVLLSDLYLHDDNGDGDPRAGCMDGLRLINVENVTLIDSVLSDEAGCYMDTGTAAVMLGRSLNVDIVNTVDSNVPATDSGDETGWDNEAFTTRTRFRGDDFANNAGAGIEMLAIHGFSSQDSDNEVSSDLFVNNGTGTSGSFGGIATTGSGVTVSGTARHNLYWDGNGFNLLFGSGGSWSGVTLSDNLSADARADAYNAQVDFSGIQGRNWWSYQYFNGFAWAMMRAFNATTPAVWNSWGAAGNSALIWPQELQPDSCNRCWVGRTWTAPHSGSISIRGWVLKALTGGSGVVVHITKNGTPIWGGSGLRLGADDQAGFATNVDTTVSQGDVIRFAINDGGSGGNRDDKTSWAPSIIYTSRCSALCIGNASFEWPGLSAGATAYQFRPGNASWAFSLGAGIAGTGSTGLNAPQGAQVAFLKGANAAIAQSIGGFVAHRFYSFAFAAAQRYSLPKQSISVYLDRTLLGTYTPSSTTYGTITTRSVAPGAGTHTLRFVGTGNHGRDVTAFIDNVQAKAGNGGSQ